MSPAGVATGTGLPYDFRLRSPSGGKGIAALALYSPAGVDVRRGLTTGRAELDVSLCCACISCSCCCMNCCVFSSCLNNSRSLSSPSSAPFSSAAARPMCTLVVSVGLSVDGCWSMVGVSICDIVASHRSSAVAVYNSREIVETNL